jgi:hypothetical protein
MAESRKPLSRKALVSALLCAAVAVASPGGMVQARPAKTRVRVFDPYTSAGELRPRLRVAKRVSGRCWEGSIASQQRDAWRCIHRNEIMDPCFKGDRPRLACLNAPWSRKVRLLELRRPLPEKLANDGIERKSYPWAIKLFSGKRCTLTTGTSAIVGDVVLPYNCNRGYASRPHRKKAIWRVRAAPDSLDSLHRRRVRAAWY